MTVQRRFPSIPALVALLILAGAGVAASPALAVNTIVVDVATGKVLSESNSTQRWYPASTTKLMTAYVALKALRTQEAALDTPVVISRAAAAEPPSKMAYPPGSVMRLDMALRMMMVKSANDVAHAIAEALGRGSLETFVGKMNAEAEALGMKDTHFVNANGLPAPGQYSSAKDLAILGVALRKEFPEFSDYFSTEAIAVGKGTMKNHNGLLGRYNGADGMKTGYICASGFNLVASATRDNRTLVAVVLGADGPIVRERTAAEILENGFNTNPRSIRDTVADLPVSSGPPADISEAICSPKGRTARANERQEEEKREDTFGSPYMTDLAREAVAVPVDLGGAAGAPGVEPGTRLIAAYGIPVPTWRPARPGEPGYEGELPVGAGEGTEHPATPTNTAAAAP